MVELFPTGSVVNVVAWEFSDSPAETTMGDSPAETTMVSTDWSTLSAAKSWLLASALCFSISDGSSQWPLRTVLSCRTTPTSCIGNKYKGTKPTRCYPCWTVFNIPPIQNKLRLNIKLKFFCSLHPIPSNEYSPYTILIKLTIWLVQMQNSVYSKRNLMRIETTSILFYMDETLNKREYIYIYTHTCQYVSSFEEKSNLVNNEPTYVQKRKLNKKRKGFGQPFEQNPHRKQVEWKEPISKFSCSYQFSSKSPNYINYCFNR